MRVLNRPDWAGDFTMKPTRHTAEQIIRQLKAAEQLIARGKTIAEVCRVIEVMQPTYHRWRQQYRGMQAEEARRLNLLEKENARLKRILAEAELEKAMLWPQASTLAKPSRREAVGSCCAVRRTLRCDGILLSPERRSRKAKDVLAVPEELTSLYPAPAFIRSDNGPELISQALRGWCEASATTTTAYIAPGSPWENGSA
jgi:transposase-like protein